MILNNINYKMAIYKDCTLSELMIVGAGIFLSTSVTLSLLTKLLFGFAWIGFSISILSLVSLTRLAAGKLQRVKYGKPYGYYQHLFLKKLSQHFLFGQLIKLPFEQRIGKWSVRRGL